MERAHLESALSKSITLRASKDELIQSNIMKGMSWMLQCAQCSYAVIATGTISDIGRAGIICDSRRAASSGQAGGT